MKRDYTMKIEKEAYCQVCDEDVSFVTKEVIKTATIRGETFKYVYIEARCKKCGELVYPPYLGKINEISMFDRYKELNGLLTSKEIIKIREENNLSQRDLAILLCCGEKNITRYENGAIQTRAFDEQIRRLGRMHNLFVYDDSEFETVSTIRIKKPVVWTVNTDNINYMRARTGNTRMEKKYGTDKTISGKLQYC